MLRSSLQQSMLDSNSSQLEYLTCNSSQLLIDTAKTAETSLVYDYGLTCSYVYLRYERNSPLMDVEIIQIWQIINLT